MKNNRQFRFESSNPWMGIVGLLVFVLVLMAIFWLARMAFTLLYYLSPVLLIATLIIDRKVILGYINWLAGLTRRNTLMGIMTILLTIVGFPVVTAFLFGRALLRRQARKAEDAQVKGEGGEYVNFQELPEEQPLDLEKPSSESSSNTSSGGYSELLD